MTTVKISDQLRAALAAHPLGLREIAREAGVADPILYRFAAGTRGLNSESIDKLARVLGLELRSTSGRKRKTKTQ